MGQWGTHLFLLAGRAHFHTFKGLMRGPSQPSSPLFPLPSYSLSLSPTSHTPTLPAVSLSGAAGCIDACAHVFDNLTIRRQPVRPRPPPPAQRRVLPSPARPPSLNTSPSHEGGDWTLVCGKEQEWGFCVTAAAYTSVYLVLLCRAWAIRAWGRLRSAWGQGFLGLPWVVLLHICAQEGAGL
jgi:hypothetical protein